MPRASPSLRRGAGGVAATPPAFKGTMWQVRVSSSGRQHSLPTREPPPLRPPPLPLPGLGQEQAGLNHQKQTAAQRAQSPRSLLSPLLPPLRWPYAIRCLSDNTSPPGGPFLRVPVLGGCDTCTTQGTSWQMSAERWLRTGPLLCPQAQGCPSIHEMPAGFLTPSGTGRSVFP